MIRGLASSTGIRTIKLNRWVSSPKSSSNRGSSPSKSGVPGRAEFLRPGTPEFDGLLPRFEALFGELTQRFNTIVRIPVDEAKPLITPPYDDGATEEEMIALWKGRFAEMYS